MKVLPILFGIIFTNYFKQIDFFKPKPYQIINTLSNIYRQW